MDPTISGLLPPQCKLVSKAGRGSSAEVFFCLPKDIIKAVKAEGPLTTNAAGFEHRLATLRASLVAIRLIREDSDREEDSDSEESGEQHTKDDPIIKEYSLLKSIQDSILTGAAIEKKRFLSATDHGMCGLRGYDSWLAVPAVEPSVSLGDLLKSARRTM